MKTNGKRNVQRSSHQASGRQFRLDLRYAVGHCRENCFCKTKSFFSIDSISDGFVPLQQLPVDNTLHTPLKT